LFIELWHLCVALSLTGLPMQSVRTPFTRF
jgi:hypothetical protein